MGCRCARARLRQTVSLSLCQSAVSALIGRADAGRQESRVRYRGSAHAASRFCERYAATDKEKYQTMRRLAVHDPSLTGALGGRRRCVLEQLNDAKMYSQNFTSHVQAFTPAGKNRSRLTGGRLLAQP